MTWHVSFDPTQHHRRTIRLPTHDYMSGGFFLTLCTHDRECTFGEVVDGSVRLSGTGRIVADQWLRSAQLRPELGFDEWVVMPNHMHAIVLMESETTIAPDRARRRAPLRRSLASLVAGFKSAVTTRVNIARRTPGAGVWQRNYYEHVIRNEHDLRSIRQYITDNPSRWGEDEENPIAWRR